MPGSSAGKGQFFCSVEHPVPLRWQCHRPCRGTEILLVSEDAAAFGFRVADAVTPDLTVLAKGCAVLMLGRSSERLRVLAESFNAKQQNKRPSS